MFFIVWWLVAICSRSSVCAVPQLIFLSFTSILQRLQELFSWFQQVLATAPPITGEAGGQYYFYHFIARSLRLYSAACRLMRITSFLALAFSNTFRWHRERIAQWYISSILTTSSLLVPSGLTLSISPSLEDSRVTIRGLPVSLPQPHPSVILVFLLTGLFSGVMVQIIIH